MSRILKWPVPIDDQEHEIGPGPVVHVGINIGDPHIVDRSVCVWTIEPDQPINAPRQVALVVGTGQPFDGWAWKHAGSVIAPLFVWHVMTRHVEGITDA